MRYRAYNYRPVSQEMQDFINALKWIGCGIVVGLIWTSPIWMILIGWI